VPFDQGRTMFGVLDELNVLQHGQVFVQYSVDRGKPGEKVRVVEGQFTKFKNIIYKRNFNRTDNGH